MVTKFNSPDSWLYFSMHKRGIHLCYSTTNQSGRRNDILWKVVGNGDHQFLWGPSMPTYKLIAWACLKIWWAENVQRSSAMCIIKALSGSDRRRIAAAFVFVQCLQQAAAATKAADDDDDAPMAFSMSTGRGAQCHGAFETCGQNGDYQIVRHLFTFKMSNLPIGLVPFLGLKNQTCIL